MIKHMAIVWPSPGFNDFGLHHRIPFFLALGLSLPWIPIPLERLRFVQTLATKYNSLVNLFPYNRHNCHRIKKEISKRNRIVIVGAVHSSILIITLIATMTTFYEGVAI